MSVLPVVAALLTGAPAQAKGGTSLAGLPGPLVSTIHLIQSRCSGFQVISAYRPGARVRGTHKRSLHADHKAADIRGPHYGCAYAVLRGFRGGVSTDPGRVHHIHLSWNPGGREWGIRFAHGGHHRHHTRYARL